MRITALYGSPRKGGNTDLLMQAFLGGLREAGAEAQELFLRDFAFSPCIDCGGCEATGACVLRDGMDDIYPHLIASDVIVLAAPVFFYGLNALAKAMVDRVQCFWARKYLLGRGLRQERATEGRGILLSVGGARGKKNFDGILLTAKYFFDALDMPFSHHLTYGGIDKKGALLEHPELCDEARKLGCDIVRT
ncbi:MAG: flavodoxin family protein [Deltaproteobacteria bacterium]|nr:flavodoxin family protein [Deltaproteobacteria bacterium]